jgi:hypothetical protein
MIYWLLKRVLRRGFQSRRGRAPLEDREILARSGIASWILAQEKARLEYVAAKEHFEHRASWHAFQRVLERLLRLQSTNAVIQSLINEHSLEEMQARVLKQSAPPDSPAGRKCA